mmetsp:Transcript_63210/g.203753  ORF Transcript_63210/g.203753 Transcript_63210/m.203753 type:complete len:206 (-) Transcript_63210:506-1123(-)
MWRRVKSNTPLQNSQSLAVAAAEAGRGQETLILSSARPASLRCPLELCARGAEGCPIQRPGAAGEACLTSTRLSTAPRGTPMASPAALLPLGGPALREALRGLGLRTPASAGRPRPAPRPGPAGARRAPPARPPLGCRPPAAGPAPGRPGAAAPRGAAAARPAARSSTARAAPGRRPPGPLLSCQARPARRAAPLAPRRPRLAAR